MKNFVSFCIIVGAIVLAVKGMNDINAKNTKGASAKVTLNSVLTSSQSGPGGQDQDQLQGKPTISAAFINRVLAANGSPAQGTGEAMYNDGVEFGIDPVYALAFFQHESGFGTSGAAQVNNSLGNERCIPNYSCNGGFAYFPTWESSYREWYKLILYGYIQGQVTIPIAGHTCSTVEQIIPVYAPSSDHNDVAGYIAAIRNTVSTWRKQSA